MPDLKDVQEQFTQLIRDKQMKNTIGDIKDERIGVYRRLVHNNITSFLETGFPVINNILRSDHWQHLVDDFIKSHPAHSPLFQEISLAFLHYLQERQPLKEIYPYLYELAHYEWAELALDIACDEITTLYQESKPDLLNQQPVVSPLAWLLAYNYPVHTIAANNRYPAPEPTYIIVYRDRTHEVGFVVVNPISAKLLELLQQNEQQTGLQVLEQLQRMLAADDAFIENGTAQMQEFLDLDIILGTEESTS